MGPMNDEAGHHSGSHIKPWVDHCEKLQLISLKFIAIEIEL